MIYKNGYIKVFFLSVLVSLLCCKNENKPVTKQTKPNIVLINIDDLGWKDLGFMGSSYYETPNIDALAKRGMTFTRAYAGAANCAPSRACLISGLNTPKHGVYTVSPSDRGHKKTRKLVPTTNTKHLNDTIYTLPKMLKSAGYITANFGKWHVGNDPNKQGVDFNVGGSSKGNPGKNGYFSPYNIDHIDDGPDGEYLTDRLTNEAIHFITKHKDSTFFLYLPYYTVHTPIMGKPKLVKQFENKQSSGNQSNAEYAAMVFAMDQNVGRLLDSLSELGLEENTIIIFTSDNGGIRAISGQDPLRAGKGSYYEGGIRVPLVIKWPNHIEAGSQNTNMVSNLDIYPTLQNIAKPKLKAKQLDGIDLNHLLKNDTILKRDLYFHFPIYLQAYNAKKDDASDPLFRTRPGSVIISGNWKLHEYFEDGRLELYNLKDDIGERKNLVETNPLKTKELYNKLKAWRKKTQAPVPKTLNESYDADFEMENITLVNP